MRIRLGGGPRRQMQAYTLGLLMTPRGLARKISKLPERAPITHSFENVLTARGIWNPERERKKYSSQKKHWEGWLSEYSGGGYYDRKNRAVRSAEVVYNRVNCPPMLLWLIEASGVRKAVVLAAKRCALLAPPSYPSQCSRIRQAAPWSMVEMRLRKPTAAYRGTRKGASVDSLVRL
jgi:hypothetical protein